MIAKKETIAVWFSCGAASAVAAYLTVKKYGDTHNVLVFNNPVFEEDKDNRRFLNDVEKWIGVPIIQAFNKKWPMASADEVWRVNRYMSGTKGAPCTRELKKGARFQVELEYNIDYHVLGFTLDEKHRHKRFVTFERKNVIPVLIDEGLTKNDCFKILIDEGLTLPRIYSILDNANCIGCVKATGIGYWKKIKKHFPEVFEERAKLSRELNVKLTRYKGKRIFIDEIPKGAKGRKSRKVDCGIFYQIPNPYKK